MIITFDVWVSTKKVNSTVKNTITVEIDDDTPINEVEKLKEQLATDWMNENINYGWE